MLRKYCLRLICLFSNLWIYKRKETKGLSGMNPRLILFSSWKNWNITSYMVCILHATIKKRLYMNNNNVATVGAFFAVPF